MIKPRKPRLAPDTFACLDDDEENLLVTIELPGVKKADIDLRMREDVIYVRAERDDIEFLGHIHSAEKINPRKAKASFEDGLLDIQVPLKERKISAVRVKID